VLEPYPVTLVNKGSIFWFAFQQPAPRRFDQVDPAGAQRYEVIHRALLERGVYLAPSAYEVFFVSTAHTADQLERTAQAMGEAFALAYPEIQQ
jgi:glutamate-1-semialdehyde 2,1-aminomutase